VCYLKLAFTLFECKQTECGKGCCQRGKSKYNKFWLSNTCREKLPPVVRVYTRRLCGFSLGAIKMGLQWQFSIVSCNSAMNFAFHFLRGNSKAGLISPQWRAKHFSPGARAWGDNKKLAPAKVQVLNRFFLVGNNKVD